MVSGIAVSKIFHMYWLWCKTRSVKRKEAELTLHILTKYSKTHYYISYMNYFQAKYFPKTLKNKPVKQAKSLTGITLGMPDYMQLKWLNNFVASMDV